MKTRGVLGLILALASSCSLSAEIAPAGEASAFVVTEAGPHHRVLSNGSGTVTELADGLNYFDGTGWKPAEERFEVLADGSAAVAQKGQFRVSIAANITTAGGITLISPDNKTFRSHVAALVYWDWSAGKSAVVAVPKDSIGQLATAGQIVFPDAFDGVAADVRYTYRAGSFEQDVIVINQPDPPEAFGFSTKTTRLQVWTEFIEAPVPTTQTPTAPQNATDPFAVAKAAPSTLLDEILAFGQMSFGRGKAFKVNGAAGLNVANPPDDSIDTGKQWVTIDGRTFLVESLDFLAAKTTIDSLPKAAALDRAQQNKNAALAPKIVPGNRSQVASLMPKNRGGKRKSGAKIQQMARADLKGRPALLIDYTSTFTWSVTDYKFQADSTYYIVGTLTAGGNTTLESAILKFTNYNASTPAQIKITGSGAKLNCKTAAYHPAIFCAKDDNSVGEIITGSTGSPSGSYAYYALYFDYYSSSVLANVSHIRIRNAYNGISFVGGTGHVLSHSQIISCYSSVKPLYADISLRNCLLYGAFAALDGSGGSSATVRNENVTFSSCANLSYPSGSSLPTVYQTNCLRSGVTSTGYYYEYGQNNQTVPSGFSAFTTVGSASHYLADDTYRGLGTTAINSDLLTDLRTRTTYPPVLLATDFSSPTVLTPEVPRNTGAVDLGYHYEPLDFVWSGRSLSSALVLTNGVAIGMYGTNGTILQSAAQFISEGTPMNFNHLVRYTAVQEMPTVWGPTNVTMSLLNLPTTPSTLPEIRMRFTDISLQGDIGTRASILDVGASQQLGVFALTDCQVHGGRIWMAPNSDTRQMTLALTNNLFERTYLCLTQATKPFPVYCRNNLFGYGTFRGNAGASPLVAWNVQDNLFDGTSIIASNVANSYNGYIGISAMSGSSGSDQTGITTRDYQSGPLGTNYYPTTGGQLSKLINAGSRSASAAGLYHHTVKVDQTKEANAQVSIGYHYIALVSGAPADGDTDGLADYFEDRNGDGDASNDTFPWNAANTDGDSASDLVEFLEGRQPRIANTISDSTGNFVALDVHTPSR